MKSEEINPAGTRALIAVIEQAKKREVPISLPVALIQRLGGKLPKLNGPERLGGGEFEIVNKRGDVYALRRITRQHARDGAK